MRTRELRAAAAQDGGNFMDATVWQSTDLARRYLTGVRGALPLAAEQIDTLLRLIVAAGIPVRRVLDLGCGDGILAAAVLDRFPGANAVGVDFSPTMLEAARNRFEHRSEAARWIAFDYADPAWVGAVAGDGLFDVIVSGFSIHHQPDAIKRRIYRDCLNLLVPGGVFLNLEHVSSGSSWDATAAEELMIDHLYAHARAGGDLRSREAIAMEFHHRPDKAANLLSPVEEQCVWLRALGFDGVDCFFRQFELALFGGRKPVVGLGIAPMLCTGIRVVPISEEHIDRFWSLVDGVARERRFLAGVEGFPLEVTRHFVRGNLARRHPHWVAVDGEEVVGWCDIVPANPFPFPGFVHSGRLGMGVRASHRGRGIGRCLLGSALASVAATGFRRVELEVYSSNNAAVSLYRKAGFVTEGIKRAARDLDGQVDDLIQMAWYPVAVTAT